MIKKHYSYPAFTIIELLVVISVIGIISGVLANTINARRQQEIAVDGHRRQKLKETVDLIEGFRAAEGYYPDDGTINNPLDSSATDYKLLSQYLSEWYPGLIYSLSSDGRDFGIYIERPPSISPNVYKYSSIWNYILECTPLAGDLNIPAVCNIVD